MVLLLLKGGHQRVVFDRSPQVVKEMAEEKAIGAASLLEEPGFDMKTQVRIQPATHTRGIIVDGPRVLVGSHNWSALGVTRNRDASLLIKDAQAAQYFERIFDHDWKQLARAKLRDKREYPRLLGSDATRDDSQLDGFIRVPVTSYVR